MAADLLAFAHLVAASYSEDPKTKVGCVITDPDTGSVLVLGWNSFPSRLDLPLETWKSPSKDEYVVHAEVNAICRAAKQGVVLDGSTCSVNLFPCADCSKCLIQAGIRRLIAPSPDLSHEKWGPNWKMAMSLLRDTKIELVLVESDTEA